MAQTLCLTEDDQTKPSRRVVRLRSLEATARRALKRGRTVEEQREIDNKKNFERDPDAAPVTKKRKKDKKNHKLTEAPKSESTPTWHLKSGPRASISHASSVQSPCVQERSGTKIVKRFKPKSEMPIEWPEQAGAERIAYNNELRKRYNENKDALTSDELARAEILVARDLRKQRKKRRRQAKKPAKRSQKKAKSD